jgi:hypothetical protein
MAKSKAKLSDFTVQSKNVNRHKNRGMKALSDTIENSGWIGAITTAANGETFAGSARLEVSYDRFGQEIEPITVHTTGDRPVIVIRDDIPTASDPKAVKLGVADNRISELNYDPDIELLIEINDEIIQLDDLYYEDELAALVASNEDEQNQGEGTNDPNEVWQGMPEFNGDAVANKSIHVHFESMDDYYQFSELINQKLTDKTRSIWFPPKPESISQVYVTE